MGQTIQQMQSKLDRLLMIDKSHSDISQAFSRGVGMVGKNRRSRDRSIDASVSRAVKITSLSERLEHAKRLANSLPSLRKRESDIDEIIKLGILKEKKMTSEQINIARSIRMEIRRSINRAERLITP